MNDQAFDKLDTIAKAPQALEASTEYLASHMRPFVRSQERVLVCYTDQSPGSLGHILAEAVRRLGGIPIFWGPDDRWKTLLRQAFVTRATMVIGEPLVVLGLTKLAKATGTPLFVESVVLTGYPSLDWMIDGIQRGLDCRIGGCYGLGKGPTIGGFSCEHSRGIHLRDDTYAVEIVDEEGNPITDGRVGQVVFYAKADPSVRYRTPERARLESAPCSCGCASPRLMDLALGGDIDLALTTIGEELHYWTSILDCRLKRTPCGIEMEIVTFFGQKLPKLPSCARQVVRNWNPETDSPFRYVPMLRKSDFSWENH